VSIVTGLSDDERLKRAIQALRTMIRDKKQLNRLLLGHFETDDAELEQCLMSAVMDWNMTPPFLAGVTLATHPNKYLLLQCAALEALRQAGIWHSREHMPSADGGTSGDDHAKAGEYSAWIDRFAQEYERKKLDQKMAQNIAEALGTGGVPSEYGTYGWNTRMSGYNW
jgi:hypothetical protein